jgi:hypothetical protein
VFEELARPFSETHRALDEFSAAFKKEGRRHLAPPPYITILSNMKKKLPKKTKNA